MSETSTHSETEGASGAAEADPLRAAIADLDGVDAVASDDQPAVFERVHDVLARALDTTVDERSH